ncbi:MAG: slipin family protein [Candidatus Aenigmarchaeota archaeon]|nr:slipin family protein [Candidatus Aenigmarchaeota archaeon]
MFESILIIVIIVALSGVKVINEYERGVILTLGKYSSTKKAGLRYVIPAVQRMIKVDMRIKAIDVPSQDAMTRDNVSVRVNAVLYYKVRTSEKAVLEVENFMYAVSQLAQTTMRNVIGEVTLDELLSNREDVSTKIKKIVDKATDPWGIEVQGVELKDVELNEEMKRVMAKEAEAEREKRAVIIKAEGEVQASTNLSKAAMVLSKAPGALHLRTLATLNDLSSDKSNTVVLGLPLEILRAIEKKK